ncbi:DHBP synthase RibB-like alpha/beta domain-containing protein [Pseudomassariella vexata]|uniref:Threonylcarbamoyl-AMP synthase n=1 Tax=Pseudomassariella vexata TaxID=1141098 RepID=A0A1Y2DE65_9PEZI|nr:DHBP synthase RibB-like alpha/beta domain-containing protein [Pseudomassariella vexata]ORY57497.1 DHBP synthase RibB-like alpha/beta domain-containing protein [Pseudomassariella vexata]
MSQDLPRVTTRVLKVDNEYLGKFKDGQDVERLGIWEVSTSDSPSIRVLKEAAEYLRTKDLPVGFPTETVYGLGADATRSGSVKSIFAAKGRPSDNPLISHFCDLGMLRDLLSPPRTACGLMNGATDPIPEIYKALINRFWPGPLTILLPNPVSSRLAPEVTAGLRCFGARMPSSPLALSLIKLAGVPLAAPSANASTRPSATTAGDVLEDMDGRIELILDGGSCLVGVESTVVDGLCDPPVVLRPGGVSMDEIRTCRGWEHVEKAYKDQSEIGKSAPRAPGMKYKHYSPRARVVLYEATYKAGESGIAPEDVKTIYNMSGRENDSAPGFTRIGVIRTQHWKHGAGLRCGKLDLQRPAGREVDTEVEADVHEDELYDASGETSIGRVLDLSIGQDVKSIAQGLFAALRELDRRKADVIFIEGIQDNEDIAAAVMNRLRKAASVIRS